MKVRKKRKFKKRYWLLIDLAVVTVILVLLLYRPNRYNPPASINDKLVSPYLTHELLPRIYNAAQFEEPFEVIITQKGINDIVARSKWPQESNGVRFSSPMVLFLPDSIVLMATANIRTVKFIVTIVAKPTLNQDGLLNLRISKVKVGAMPLTFPAKIIARRMYLKRLASIDVDVNDINAQIAASLLNNESFEPVFDVEDKKVRVEEITVKPEKITIRLTPAYN